MADTAEFFRQLGVRELRCGRHSEARKLFEQSLVAARTETEAARAAVQVAWAAILAAEESPFIHELPSVVLSRRDTLNTYLAAYYYATYLIDNGAGAASDKYIVIALETASLLEDRHYYAAIARDLLYARALSRRDFRDAAEEAARAIAEIELAPPSEEVAVAKAVMQHNLGYALLGVGKVTEAIDCLERGLCEMNAAGVLLERSQVYINLAFACLVDDRIDTAEKYLLELERCVDRTSDGVARYRLLLHGDIAQRRGHIAEALAYYERLQKLYPDFRSLSSLLLSVNLLPVLMP